MGLEDKISELTGYAEEQEWFEFKENWFQPDELGEYVSAISNSAAFHYQEMGYFVWGVKDDTHEIVGTSFDPYLEYHKEPYQNYLARNLSPSLNFSFRELEVKGKRVVILLIPPAEEIPTSFKDVRYIRIGSSKVNLKKYPKREVQLFRILSGREETIVNKASEYQDLTFHKLFGYYGSKGIVLKERTFVKNLKLKTASGEYNLLAQLLSDDSHVPLRVSIFQGKTKASPLLSVREFGNNCLLYSLDGLLQYGEVLNIIQADEENRIVERKDVPLFDQAAFREAVINAVLHNNWVSLNEPMISVFSDRMEILSRGPLPPSQTKEGFYSGESVPVNEKLSEIFLQLHISEKSGRGVPTIVERYGKEAIDFRENSIVVTIPFNWIHQEQENDVDRKNIKPSLSRPPLNPRRKAILLEMKQNPYISKPELAEKMGISVQAITKNISFLRENGYLTRVGKTRGYWKTID